MITYSRIVIVWICFIGSLRVTKATMSVFENCISHQEGTIGHSQVIRCTIKIKTEGIYWFEQYIDREPVIRYEDGRKIGRGYENHEYDIENDGSLRINKVSEDHQMLYKVVVIDKLFNYYERKITFVVHGESLEMIPFTNPYHQFGLVGKSAIIQFNISADFQGVYWYDEQDTQDPFIRYEEGTKLGRGYENGEYDIYPNGSLKIFEVTIDHDIVYSVVVIDSLYNTEEYSITFTTIVYPEQGGPRITNCTTESICHVYIEELNYLHCSILGARPGVDLKWFQRTPKNETFLLSGNYINEPNDNSSYLFDSSAIVFRENVPNITPFILVCKGTGPALGLNGCQDELLVESKDRYDMLHNLTGNSVKVIYIINGKSVSLSCPPVTKESLIIWRKGPSIHMLQTILYSFYGNEVTDPESEIAMNKTGHLLLFNAQLYQEKLFLCITVKNNESELGQIYKLGFEDLSITKKPKRTTPTYSSIFLQSLRTRPEKTSEPTPSIITHKSSSSSFSQLSTVASPSDDFKTLKSSLQYPITNPLEFSQGATTLTVWSKGLIEAGNTSTENPGEINNSNFPIGIIIGVVMMVLVVIFILAYFKLKSCKRRSSSKYCEVPQTTKETQRGECQSTATEAHATGQSAPVTDESLSVNNLLPKRESIL